MTLDLPTPRGLANQIIMLKGLLGQMLTDPKYKKFTPELQIIKKFQDGEASFLEISNALENMTLKSTP